MGISALQALQFHLQGAPINRKVRIREGWKHPSLSMSQTPYVDNPGQSIYYKYVGMYTFMARSRLRLGFEKKREFSYAGNDF